jgi:UvrD-like helicase C-terminal domain/AAA domain
LFLSLEYFEGPAGCGKTYQLVEALKVFLASHPLGEDQAILGLTYMHGSRRRMHSRLTKLAALRGRFLASTVDSLARSIVWRWRTLARDIQPQLDLSGVVDFDMVCNVAANLLCRQSVFGWFCIRYPIVIVDEFQDCKGERLCIIQAIESCCHVIAAADEYQDLQPDGQNAAVAWLHTRAGKQTVLTGNRRTKQSVLLEAAGQLRSSQDCGTALGNTLLSGRNANAAAGGVARTLTWKRCKDVVILTPNNPENNSFVRDVVERLTSKSIQPTRIPKPVGPFRIIWESNVAEARSWILSKFTDKKETITLQEIQELTVGDNGALSDLREWAERKYRMKGQTDFLLPEISEATDRILQSRRAFLPYEHPGIIRAMTISQAKNREFDGVVILWPFAVGGDLESQRRRLYNALARAHSWAVVIVQENVKDPSRLCGPPFSRPVKPAVAGAKKGNQKGSPSL